MKKIVLLFPFFYILQLLGADAQAQRKEEVSIREFVTQFYIHGIPANEAEKYSSQDVPVLAAMLKDPVYQKSWMNIVIVLGYIGSSKATKPLVQFVDSQQGEISVETFRAVLYVFQSLGHIARKDSDKQALKALEDYLSLDSWKTKDLHFSFSRYRNEALSEVLARQAIQGLGVSGKPEANRALSDLRKSKDLRSDWVDNVDEAISRNSAIQARGVEKTLNRK
ncbi:hypothetical protein [Hymenobacter cavernae]|uniref:HEAT repeat domain-containing protein n=1 Tax=Hymenobacter cavernae TaxID=2044852 RepID=A0ABQ1UKZ1_9BACT|nr:hypothetical protein [Hymenobacter cavernae]GGF21613.1 hypothetical protein GCM10011383_36540 [Hymenobacter cavernae]